MKYIFTNKNKKVNIAFVATYTLMTCFFGIIVFGGLDAELNRGVQYDCRMLMGGWHPDVPPEVLNECRKMKNKGIVYRYDT